MTTYAITIERIQAVETALKTHPHGITCTVLAERHNFQRKLVDQVMRILQVRGLAFRLSHMTGYVAAEHYAAGKARLEAQRAEHLRTYRRMQARERREKDRQERAKRADAEVKRARERRWPKPTEWTPPQRLVSCVWDLARV